MRDGHPKPVGEQGNEDLPRRPARNVKSNVIAKTPHKWHKVSFDNHGEGASENMGTFVAATAAPTYEASRQKEIDGLLESEVFRLVPRSSLPKGTRLFNSRFVDEVKHPGTEDAYEKSRLVIQAYNDVGKSSVLTQSPTIQRASQRLLICLFACFPEQLTLYLRDISQAYTQSTTSLQREFYALPPKGIDLGDWIMKVLKPLYGVPESGNHWYGTYHTHHTDKLGMVVSTFDPCLLFHGSPDNLTSFAVLGLQTDDTCFAAGAEFASKEEEELKKAGFMAKPREQLAAGKPVKFNGGVLTLSDDGSVLLNQEYQCNNLSEIVTNKTDITSSRGEVRKAVDTQGQFVSQRARSAYVATVCQPEASFDCSRAAQNHEPGAEGEKKMLTLLNKRIVTPASGNR